MSKDVTQKFAKSQDHYEEIVKQNMVCILNVWCSKFCIFLNALLTNFYISISIKYLYKNSFHIFLKHSS